MPLIRRAAAIALIPVVVATLFAPAAFGAEVGAASTTVRGRIVAEIGAVPVSGAVVTAHLDGTEQTDASRSAVTDDSGLFEVELDEGTSVTLRAEPPTTALAPMWWSSEGAEIFASDAGRLQIDDDEDGSLGGGERIAVELPAGRSISGSITGGRSNAPVGGATVSIESSAGDEVASVSTDASGAYRVEGLPPVGTIVIGFAAAGFRDEWWRDSATRSRAVEESLLGDDLSGIDATLTSDGGAISGRVSSSGGVAEAEIDVFLRGCDGECLRAAGSTTTDADGRFTVEGLAEGDYVVAVQPVDGQTDAAGAALAPATVDLAVVGDGEATAEVLLEAGGVLEGRVLANATDGSPLAGAAVRVRSVAPATGQEAVPVDLATVTDADGRYRVDGLAEGAVSVEAALDGFEMGGATRDLESAIALGRLTARVPIVLYDPASTAGTVSDRAGRPAAGTVALEPVDESSGFAVASTSAADGRFRHADVEPGRYRVAVTIADETRYWGADGSAASARLVTVPPGAVIDDLEVGFAPPAPVAATLSGRVGDGAGDAVAGSRVEVFPASGPAVARTLVGDDGSYSVTVAPGDYRIKFTPPSGLASGWFGGATSRALAATVGVGEGETRGGLDATLSSSAELGVRVLLGEEATSGVSGALYTLDGVRVQTRLSGADGEVLFTALPAGSYRIKLTAAGFAPRWTPTVDVAPGSSGSVDDVSLAAGGTLSGTVSIAGAAAGGAIVQAWDDQGKRVATVTARPDGGFAIRGLPAGDYRVRAVPLGHGIVWTGGADRLAEASRIRVDSGGEATVSIVSR